MKLVYQLLILTTVVPLLVGSTAAQDLLFHSTNSEVFVSSGGRLVIDNPVSSRGMSRWAFMNLAVSKNNVYNFDDSIRTVAAATVDSTSILPKADYVVKHIAFPDSGTLAPNQFTSSVHHIMWVYLWKDLKGVVAAYRLKNVGSASLSGRLSFELYPRIDQSYGGHSLRWRSQDSIAYYFRSGGAHYLGAKDLSGRPTGVKLSTGTTFFQPGVSAAESQLDSIRYSAALYGGFDTAVDSGGTTSTPRSMIHINTGDATIARGDSTQWFYFAIAYDTTQAGMLQALADVQARYKTKLTTVERLDRTVPATYVLHQNYPNPFNPSTHIRFDLKEENVVSVKVYDVLGREVQQLVNDRLSAGLYQVEFNAEDLPTGVYFSRLQAGPYSHTVKMLLTK